MFVIHGIFKDAPTERLVSNLTEFSVAKPSGFIHAKAYTGEVFNFEKTYGEFKKNISHLNSFPKKGVILPPSLKLGEFYLNFCDFLIIRFPYFAPLTPCMPITLFEKKLLELSPIKHRVLIELSGDCTDFDMYSASFDIFSYNQAVLKCAIKSSKVFFDRNSYYSYYTYLSEKGTPHLVFMEDTQSISKKHNLIKKAGYLGICWKNVAVMADGNWESLKGVYENR